MRRDIVPIAELQRRLPTQGRIRLGARTVKGAPRKLDAFRFTSYDEKAIEEIASLYGGGARPWADGPSGRQFEVFTEATTIPIALPPDPLGGTPVYELWSGGGCMRRCDGETAVVPRSTPDGSDLTEVACLCERNQELVCKPTTRLTVVLRDIRFGGGWRLESHGWTVAHELPGMVQMVEQLQVRGLVCGELALEERVSKKGGKTFRFVVPVVRPGESIDKLAAGVGVVGALAPAAPAALPVGDALPQPDPPAAPSPSAGAPPASADDEIVDAELVDDFDEPTVQRADPRLRAMHAMMRELEYGDDERHALVGLVSKGRTFSSTEMTEAELERMLSGLRQIKDGRVVFDGIDMDTKIAVVRSA